MADNITILDSAEVEKTIATKELAGAVHANKQVMIDPEGNPFGYADDEIAFPVQVTEDIFHYAVHEGVAYNVAVHALTGDLHIAFTTPNVDTYFHTLYDFGGEGNTIIHVYEGVTFGGGSADQVAYSNNRAAAMNGKTTSSCIAGTSATAGSVQVGIASTGGTLIRSMYAAKGGGTQDASHEIVLEKNTNYYFHLDNTDNKDCGMSLQWFEVPMAT